MRQNPARRQPRQVTRQRSNPIASAVCLAAILFFFLLFVRASHRLDARAFKEGCLPARKWARDCEDDSVETRHSRVSLSIAAFCFGHKRRGLALRSKQTDSFVPAVRRGNATSLPLKLDLAKHPKELYDPPAPAAARRVCLRTVSRSISSVFSLKPRPASCGTLMNPCADTSTAGSMMSSFQ
jgi:hypothetical protein